LVVCAFEFHPEGEIVAALATPPTGEASVPSAPCARGELEHLPVATDQEVRGNLEILQRLKVGVGGEIERIGEKLDDGITAEHAWRQTDAVND